MGGNYLKVNVRKREQLFDVRKPGFSRVLGWLMNAIQYDQFEQAYNRRWKTKADEGLLH